MKFSYLCKVGQYNGCVNVFSNLCVERSKKLNEWVLLEAAFSKVNL